MQDEVIATPTPHKRVPWNKGKLTGAKPTEGDAAMDPPRTIEQARRSWLIHPRVSYDRE